MKKQFVMLIVLSLLLILPVIALAISDVSVQYNGKWYDFNYDKAKFEKGYLVIQVTCPDGLPIVKGSPKVPVTAAIDVNGERLEAAKTNVSILGSYAYYYFYFNTDAAPNAIWLYPDGDAEQAKLLRKNPKVSMPTPTPSPVPDPLDVFETMTFGSFEQDNNESNGPEPIEWLVLANDGEKATLISKYGLYPQPYNAADEKVTWETCGFRQWLNNDFLNAAFSKEEQARLVTVLVTPDEKANAREPVDQGNAVYDQVYALSCTEVEAYFPSEETRVCYPTKYAKAKKVYRYQPNMGYPQSGATNWWLRTRVTDFNKQTRAWAIKFSGEFSGTYITNDDDAVRPVIQLWLSPDQPLPTPEPMPGL